MKAYGFPERRRTVRMAKTGAGYRTAARQWWKRHLHKSARTKAKEEIKHAQATQTQETLVQDVQATQNGMGEPMETQRTGCTKTL
jgi:hypothetical protein